jgi:hypothetical protein
MKAAKKAAREFCSACDKLWQRARLEGVFNLHSRFILWLLHQRRLMRRIVYHCGKATGE